MPRRPAPVFPSAGLAFVRAIRPSFRSAAGALALCLALPASAQSLLVVEDPAERIAVGQTFTLLDGFVASDAVPPYYLTDDPWPVRATPRPGRNLAVASGRSALGARVGPATIDYFYRRDWWFEGSAGSVRYYELDRTGGLVASGQTLDLDHRWEGFDADGLRLSFAERFGVFRPRDTVAGVSVAGLRLQQVRRESARGRLASNGTTADLQAQREVWYSGFEPEGSDSLTGFRPAARLEVPSYGYGYTVDLGLHHEFGAAGHLRLVVSDAISHVKWGGVPHLTQSIAIAGAASDAGLDAAAPGVSERAAYDTLRFALPPKVLLGGELAVHRRWRLVGEQLWHRNESFPLLGLAWRATDATVLRIDHDLRWRTVGLRLAYKRFALGLRTDDLSPRKARAGGATLRVELDF